MNTLKETRSDSYEKNHFGNGSSGIGGKLFWLELHGGSITVEKGENGYTKTFVIRF